MKMYKPQKTIRKKAKDKKKRGKQDKKKYTRSDTRLMIDALYNTM